MTDLSTRFLKAVLPTLVIACGAGSYACAQTSYLTYHNERFGFAIQYPNTFRLSEPPANGDGIAFLAPDHAADFRAFSGFNALD